MTKSSYKIYTMQPNFANIFCLYIWEYIWIQSGRKDTKILAIITSGSWDSGFSLVPASWRNRRKRKKNKVQIGVCAPNQQENQGFKVQMKHSDIPKWPQGSSENPRERRDKGVLPRVFFPDQKNKSLKTKVTNQPSIIFLMWQFKVKL